MNGSETFPFLSMYNGPTKVELVINDGGADLNTRLETDGDTHMLFADGGGDKLCVSTDTPLAAKLTIVQDDASGESCLSLDQNDESEGFIDFVGSDRGPVTTAVTNSVASVRVELNGTKYLVPLYTDA